MNSLDACQRIALLLRGELERGFPLSDPIRSYAEATLGTSSFVELAEILNDEDNCEREPLLDLLLFPDNALKARVEELLPDTQEQSAFPARLLQDFQAHPLQSGLMFPKTEQMLRFSLSEDLLQRFVARLHLDAVLPQGVLEATAAFAPEMRAQARIRLRCTRSAFPDRTVELVRSFCRRFPAPQAVFCEHLEYLLRLLDTLPPAADPFQELQERKRLAHQLIRQAQDFERKLQREPIEALMLRGERCPSTSIQDARQEMERIDRISLALFGRTETIPEEISLDHGSLDPEHEMEALFNLFQE